MIKSFKGISPKIDASVFVAEGAVIIGDVEIGAESSVWFNAVLRGDVDRLKVGKKTNVQDLAMLHCSTDLSDTVIGDGVTIGHGAIVHGAKVGDYSLIGMGAKVLDLVVVEKHVIVAAGAVVPMKMVLESGWLYAGVPAKKIKPLTEAQIESLYWSADHYAETAKEYMEMAGAGGS